MPCLRQLLLNRSQNDLHRSHGNARREANRPLRTGRWKYLALLSGAGSHRVMGV
jgi:hypothetical protein